MSFFKDIALPLAARDIPVIPLRPRTKIAFLEGWQELATTDAAQIEAWDAQYPDANCACVAKAQPGGVWFWELDNAEVAETFKKETGLALPKTFRVRSRPGRGHFYFRHNAASIAMGNIAQNFVKGEGFSVRVNREYVVSPGSLHPISGEPYALVSTAPIIEADERLIQWFISQKTSAKQPTQLSSTAGPIGTGSRNSALTSLAGTLRQKGLDAIALEAALQAINREQCSPPLDPNEVTTIARSVARYEVKPNPPCIIGGQDVTSSSASQASSSSPSTSTTSSDIEPVNVKRVPYPVFPEWVMKGTSIYEGLVKPVCEVNSRYPEFMFMPALLMLMNYIGCRVHIAENQTIGGEPIRKNLIPSLFLVMIGRKGKVIKSSSAEDAIEYFRMAGLADWASPHMKNADGKALVWSVGSPEGLGIDMARLNCNNGVLFYDELSRLTEKAGIETSGLVSNLLTLYESGFFANQIKRKQESYSLPAGSYCASLIACTTDKNFHSHWSKLSGDSSGLDERFFFLFQPQVLKETTPLVTVNTKEGTVLTRQRAEAAVRKGFFSIVDSSPFAQYMKEHDDNRSEIRAEKFALAFAVDRGLDEIDEDCVERGLALATYERAAKKWLQTFESKTREGAIQQEILHRLRQEGGTIPVRKLEQDLHATSHGTSMWTQAFTGLIRAGWTATRGTGRRGHPLELILIRELDEEES